MLNRQAGCPLIIILDHKPKRPHQALFKLLKSAVRTRYSPECSFISNLDGLRPISNLIARSRGCIRIGSETDGSVKHVGQSFWWHRQGWRPSLLIHTGRDVQLRWDCRRRIALAFVREEDVAVTFILQADAVVEKWHQFVTSLSYLIGVLSQTLSTKFRSWLFPVLCYLGDLLSVAYDSVE